MIRQVPIAIVAHPRREAYANKLATRVAADAVCWDIDKIGPERNHLKAWEWLADSGQGFGVVLEDDVIPTRNFRHNVNQAIKHAPTRLIALYLGRGRPPQHQQAISRTITRPVSFITAPRLLSAQAYILPTELYARWKEVRHFFGHQDQRRPIDEAISAWVDHKVGEKFSYTRFSLVDHLDGPTLVRHPDGQDRNGKTALHTEDCDPKGAALPEIRKAWLLSSGQVDWTCGSMELS